jgi:SAM-dependent methyltransferase
MLADQTSVLRYWTSDKKRNFLNGKKLLLLPWEAADLLVAMDLMNPEGSLTRSQTKKLFQVNHMLQLLKPYLSQLAKAHETLRICEAACGHSYVGLLLAWYFQRIEPKNALILGMDSNPKVIARSRQRAEELGLDGMIRFEEQGLENFDWKVGFAQQFGERAGDIDKARPHLFVALHACDSLSCRALNHAIRLSADVIAIAPCCQAELAQKWKDLAGTMGQHPLGPIVQSPHLRRSLAADYTDSLRLLLMRSLGYKADAIEFVPSEHTPKNRLLIGTRHQRFERRSYDQFRLMKASIGDVTVSLEGLLEPLLQSHFPPKDSSVLHA